MKIAYVQSIGEGDDECVSLVANHLDCYLIGKDSDYYFYTINIDSISFDDLHIQSEKHQRYFSLSAYLYTVDSLPEYFNDLDTSTLALAYCLCGNDYISVNMTKPLINHIKCKRENRTTHFNNVEEAILNS